MHCFWGLPVKWILEFCCAHLYMTFHVYVFPALYPCNCTDRNYVRVIAEGFGFVHMEQQFYMYVCKSTVATFRLIT